MTTAKKPEEEGLWVCALSESNTFAPVDDSYIIFIPGNIDADDVGEFLKKATSDKKISVEILRQCARQIAGPWHLADNI